MQTAGVNSVTETTLTGTSDTFTYREGVGQILILRNATGGALSPVIDGASGTTVPVKGIGSVSVASGYTVGSIAAGAVKAIQTDTIREYLKGTIAITTATGLVASLLEF
jgi:hypothetical protein